MIEGSVDLVTSDGAVGWLGDKDGDTPFEVVALLRGLVIGEATASLPRPDLAPAGFNGGNCGFEVFFGAKLPDRDLAFISFSPKGSQLALPRSTPDLYCDALHAIASAYPAAGRHRSVYGGLWTDRTDALQIVVGRSRAGLCDAPTSAALRSFVADGFVELKTEGKRALPPAAREVFAAARPDVEALKAASEALAALAFTPATAALLRAIFDDTPVFYRPRLAPASAPFVQAAAFEAMSSPAELLLAYVPIAGEGARLDYVFDSHELPEFSAVGASRWSPRGAGEVGAALCGLNRPVQSREMRAGTAVLVGPGLIHRVVSTADAPALCIALSPQRVSPLRYLKEEWIDLPTERGMRGRI